MDIHEEVFARAKELRVVDVWQAHNETGWVTPKALYDPAVTWQGRIIAPTYKSTRFWMDHGTVGSNTLAYWGEGGSLKSGLFTLAKYLVPHEYTIYADDLIHDTTLTVFKMIPDGYACNHTGDCITPINNTNSVGIEYESLQNGSSDISRNQLLNGALVTAQGMARYKVRDHFRVPHGLVAEPWGRRTDPWAGLFRLDLSWSFIRAIREDERIWAYWGLPQPKL